MAEWAVQIGIFDICYALTSLNRFSAAVNIFGYLQSVPGKRKCVVVSPEDIEEISGKGVNVIYWL